MNKYIKYVILAFFSVILVGCTDNMTPSERVEETLNRYIKNDPRLLEELDEYMDTQNLNDEQKDRYKEIIKAEYSEIKYEIKEETIDGDEAVVQTLIKVRNLYLANKNAENELITNPSKFYDDGIYSRNKFIDYKLDLMDNTNEMIEYTIEFELNKINGVWQVNELSRDTLEKIHGIFNYEEN